MGALGAIDIFGAARAIPPMPAPLLAPAPLPEAMPSMAPLSSAKLLVPEPLAERALAILAETVEWDEDEAWDDEGEDLEDSG